jgi:Predicted metal-binding integral membrane protein (DUF2182)
MALPSGLGSKGETHLRWLPALVGGGYFFVWTVFGIIIFPIGAGLAELEMQLPALSRTVPMAVATVVLIAGGFQFTRWKACHLAGSVRRQAAAGSCQPRPGRYGGTAFTWASNAVTAALCLMSILLVLGVMDLRTNGGSDCSHHRRAPLASR